MRITSLVTAHGEKEARHIPFPSNSYQSAGSSSKHTSREDFPTVLEGHVAIWWKGIKQTIENWDGAVSSLCDVYSSKYSRKNNGTINRTDRKSTPINIDNQLRYITKEIEWNGNWSQNAKG
ncbi:hypothetical protein CBL_20623, partial [Carabus blaptoides fortunei]